MEYFPGGVLVSGSVAYLVSMTKLLLGADSGSFFHGFLTLSLCWLFIFNSHSAFLPIRPGLLNIPSPRNGRGSVNDGVATVHEGRPIAYGTVF